MAWNDQPALSQNVGCPIQLLVLVGAYPPKWDPKNQVSRDLDSLLLGDGLYHLILNPRKPLCLIALSKLLPFILIKELWI